MSQKMKAALTGALAGIANGFFGSGGGMVLIPMFLHFLKMDERKTFATSVFVIAPLSAVSALIYFLRGSLELSAAWPYLLGGLIGGFVGGKLFKNVSLDLLRRAFGIMMIYGGVRAFL